MNDFTIVLIEKDSVVTGRIVMKFNGKYANAEEAILEAKRMQNHFEPPTYILITQLTFH